MENSAGMTPEAVGTRKGDYEILGLLGSGGMGQVYKVRNVFSDRIEAMKVLLPSLASQKNLADRFVREIKVLAGLHHPNIAELRTALMLDDQLVMIMEYVDGATLAARVQQGAIPYGQALEYINQVLSALSYAHKQHIIHRDIKPANMMLTPEGVVKLMDFGIARHSDDVGLTMTNTTLGSLAYMSPEQIKDQIVDARSDLYSVGVSLYELVTGQRPFQTDTAFSTMQAHLQTPARPPIEIKPDLPPAISSLVLMAIEKDPARRFQSADAFAAAVKSVAPDLARTVTVVPIPTPAATLVAPPVGATVASSMPPPVATHSAHRGLYIALGAVIVLVVLALGGLYVPRYARTHAVGGNASTAPPAPSANPPAAAEPASEILEPGQSPVGTIAAGQQPPAADQSTETPPAQPAASGPPAQTAMRAQAAPEVAPPPPPKPAGPDPQQLQAMSDQIDQISGRAEAVNASLETLQKQQAAQGYGLRGDMVAAQARMQTDIARAQSALKAKDLAAAQKYLDMADQETETLEHFLGR